MNEHIMTREAALERMAELRGLLDAEDTDLDAVATELAQLEEVLRSSQEEGTAPEEEAAAMDATEERSADPGQSQAERRAALRQQVAAGLAGTVVRNFRQEEKHMNENTFGAGTKEYRSAFFKNLMGKDMSAEERAAFVHTTANTAAVLPTETLNEIWNLVTGQHSIMGDIRILRSGTTIEVIKHTAIAQGDAATVAENTAGDDEQNTFVKVTLAGKDFTKHIDVSYALERMSVDAFESYIVNEIAAQLGEALAKDVVTNAIIAKMKAANKVTTAAAGKIAFKELAAAFGLLKRAGQVTVYGTRKTIYTYLVGMEDGNGRPIFQPNANDAAVGVCLGAQVKVEDAVADGVLLIGDGSKVTYNMVQDIMIESDKNIKQHVTTYAGYARGEGALIDDEAFATLTLKSGT